MVLFRRSSTSKSCSPPESNCVGNAKLAGFWNCGLSQIHFCHSHTKPANKLYTVNFFELVNYWLINQGCLGIWPVLISSLVLFTKKKHNVLFARAHFQILISLHFYLLHHNFIFQKKFTKYFKIFFLNF